MHCQWCILIPRTTMAVTSDWKSFAEDFQDFCIRTRCAHEQRCHLHHDAIPDPKGFVGVECQKHCSCLEWVWCLKNQRLHHQIKIIVHQSFCQQLYNECSRTETLAAASTKGVTLKAFDCSEHVGSSTSSSRTPACDTKEMYYPHNSSISGFCGVWWCVRFCEQDHQWTCSTTPNFR